MTITSCILIQLFSLKISIYQTLNFSTTQKRKLIQKKYEKNKKYIDAKMKLNEQKQKQNEFLFIVK